MAPLQLVAALAPSAPPPRREPRKPPPPGAHLARGVALAAVAATVAVASASPPALAALAEPANALSLPTWAVHVSSVAEWVTAMALVWDYGERTGLKGWKGLSWGMVPLLGGAMCACTWHFFYNSESLEVDGEPGKSVQHSMESRMRCAKIECQGKTLNCHHGCKRLRSRINDTPHISQL